MRKHLPITLFVSLVLLSGACLFTFASFDIVSNDPSLVQDIVASPSKKLVAHQLPVTKKIYKMDAVMQDLPYVMLRNTNLLAEDGDSHAAADEEYIYEINSEKISSFLADSETFANFYQKVRIDVIQFLLDNNYSSFYNKPYQAGNLTIIESSGDYVVAKDITEEDGLDILLKDKLQGFEQDFSSLHLFAEQVTFKNIGITSQEYNQLGTLFLFKNEQDLRDLGYELVSRDSRINTDADYRRYNISTAFANIGNVRLLMPNQTFSLGNEIHYSERANDGKKPYVEGLATLGAGAGMVYGGGLCGAATALYQGTLTNKGLALMEYFPHSVYYRNLYDAEINGQMVKDPGLDATLFAGRYDFKVKNIRDYPIITVFNYDGNSGSIQQMFTLAKAQDKGSFQYIGAFKKGTYSCFTWKINDADRTNCYRKIRDM